RTGFTRKPPGCARKCARRASLQLPGSLDEIARAHDVVAVEYPSRPVAGDLHGHSLRHARVDQVAAGRDALVRAPAVTTDASNVLRLGSRCRRTRWIFGAAD